MIFQLSSFCSNSDAFSKSFGNENSSVFELIHLNKSDNEKAPDLEKSFVNDKAPVSENSLEYEKHFDSKYLIDTEHSLDIENEY